MSARDLILLGLETSCDETAAAVVSGRVPGPGVIHASIIASQVDAHKAFGGVVPEIAARAHAALIDIVTERALETAGFALSAIDGIAVSAGPGLIGGVAAGLNFAKGVAAASGKPLIALNHLEAHALTVRLTHGTRFPFLLLLVSGGHCQLLRVEGLGRMVRLGTTLDDAAGEAFDKTAKLIGLGYPGGPAIEAAAARGNPKRFTFARPLEHREGFDFSFSGLKTNVRRTVETLGTLDGPTADDLAASFQAAAVDALTRQTAKAMAAERQALNGNPVLVVAGGVAANGALRHALAAAAHIQGYTLTVPPPSLCTDNAAMVAWAGLERLEAGLTSGMDAAPRARWPLDQRYAGLPKAKA